MLYRLLGFLLKNDDFDNKAKARHITYAILCMGVGSVTLSQGWYFFGTMSCIFGVLLGFTVILGMNWDKSIEYWQSIANVFEAATKIKDDATRYELLKSMGYNVLPSKVSVIETRQDEHGVFQGMSLKQYPVSPAIMQTIADKVLGEYITKGTIEFEFKEEDFGFVPKVRKVKDKLKTDKLITQKNAKNYRLGYRWTKAGIDKLYEFASEGVKLEIKRKKENDRKDQPIA